MELEKLQKIIAEVLNVDTAEVALLTTSSPLMLMIPGYRTPFLFMASKQYSLLISLLKASLRQSLI